MSTRFESANSERASRTSFPTNTAITFGGYFYLHSLPTSGNFAPLISLYGSFEGFWVGVNSAGRLYIENYAFGNNFTGTTVLSTGTWYYLWGRTTSAGSPLTLYLNASTTAELTTSPANIGLSVNPMTLQFASNEAGFDTNYHADVSLSGWKLWSIDRAASNAATEDNALALQSTTSALGEWHFLGTDINDKHTTARHLTATGTLSAGPSSPVDSSGAVTLALPLLTNTSTLYAPAAVGGALTLAVPLLSNTSTLHVPAVAIGGVAVAPPLLSNSSSVFVPTVAVTAGTLSPPLLASSAQLHTPAIATGSLTVSVPLLSNTSTLYAPAVNETGTADTIIPPLLASTAVLYEPAIFATAVGIAPPLLVNVAVFHVPTVAYGTVTVILPLMPSGEVLFAPRMGLEVALETVDLSLLFSRTIGRQLEFTREITRELRI